MSLSPDASFTTLEFLGYKLVRSREVESYIDQLCSPVTMVGSKHDVLNIIIFKLVSEEDRKLPDGIDLTSSNFTEEQREQFNDFLSRWNHIFSKDIIDCGKCDPIG